MERQKEQVKELTGSFRARQREIQQNSQGETERDIKSHREEGQIGIWRDTEKDKEKQGVVSDKEIQGQRKIARDNNFTGDMRNVGIKNLFWIIIFVVILQHHSFNY